MNTTRTRSGVRLCAALLLLLACLLSAGPAAAAPSDPPADPDGPGGQLQVVLTDIRPLVLEPGDDLVVRGTVHNGTGQPVAQPEVRMRAQASTPISRSLLERWLDPGWLSSTVLLGAEFLDDPLPPGGTADFSLTVAAGALPLAQTYGAWGPRGLEVTVHDAAEAQLEPAAVRSFLLWWPDIEVETMPLGVLAAASPTAPERLAARESQVSLAAAAAARLGPLLAALDHPGVDLAVDPALLVDRPPVPELAPAPPDADEPPAPPSDATRDEAVTALRAALAEFAPADEVHALPWGDADVAALAHTGHSELLTDLAGARDTALAATGMQAGTALGWPAGEDLDATTLDALLVAGNDRIVVPSTELGVTATLTYTPSARVDLDVGGRTVAAAVVDERLSQLLTGTLLPVNPREEATPTQLDPLTARQYLLAETAVVTRERPSDRRDLLLTLPRDFSEDPALIDAQLAALAAAPWLDRVALTEMFAHEAPDLPRESLPERLVDPGEVSAELLERARRVIDRTAAFAGILADPDELVDAVQASLREVTSTAWRELPEARSELVAEAETAQQDRRALVAAQPGSTLNLINETAHIPVSVTNEMNRSAQVQVQLAPRDPRLVADEAVELEIPAGQTATAQVPVQAVGSGDVVVEVFLAAPDGTPIDDPVQIQVRVRADWETFGTAVVAGILALMLVVGLVRTVRRAGRRPEPEGGES